MRIQVTGNLTDYFGNAEWYSRKQWGFFKIKLNIYYQYDPAIPLLSIYLIEIKTYSHENLFHNNYSSFIHIAKN